MPRPNCIYCPNPTGSREHIFPAALGGRRKNKGILCKRCNGGFSDLDRKLAAQLQHLRGLLGVRPDHKDCAVPAEVPHEGGTLLIDALGAPSYKEPRTLADEPLENGNRRVLTAFANERQVAEWRAEQRKKGLTIKDESMKRVGRFMTEPIAVEWGFGGEETFREAARIALNFLAHKFPAEARDARLRPLKDYIQGTRVLQPGDVRPVWHHRDQVGVPASNVELGHQVFIRLDRELGTGYAVLRFFEAVELVVDLGPLTPAETCAVLFNIDPHAEHEPKDLYEVACRPGDFPESVTTLKVGEEPGARMGDPQQLARTLNAIGERQSRLRLARLVAELARVRATDSTRWRDAVHEALGEHEGPIYRLVEFAAKGLSRRFGENPELTGYGIEECLAALVEPDPRDPTGITLLARAMVHLAREELADAIATELERGPITLDRAMLLLEGGSGVAIVGKAMMEHVLAALDRNDAEQASDGP